MKILIVNTYDKGGAANAALRLHKGLLDFGVDSKVLLKEKSKAISETYEFKSQQDKSTVFQILKRKAVSGLRKLGLLAPQKKTKRQQYLENRRKEGLEFFSFPESTCDITSSPLYEEADIINLHWVANFMDYKSFLKKNTKPVVWTLHDKNPFTGGEHYTETIVGINDFGDPIQRKFTVLHYEMTNVNLETKKLALEDVVQPHIVSLCNWMSAEVKNNSIFMDFPLHVIPNGIDSNTFKIKDKVECRRYFNIPEDKTVILFIADSINNKRKGYAFLQHAFGTIDDSNVLLCAIGKNSSENHYNDNCLELGQIQDEATMSKAYAMADVFVIPSLMDNLPNTVIESLLCGTPVIGFNVGGITDMIVHGKNGLLAESISSKSLQKSIHFFLATKDQFNREIIRSDAKKKYAIEVQAEAYKKLFQSLLN